MAPPAKLAHVVYMTRRFEEMLDWYQKVFEARVQYQNPALAFLTYDDEHHRFAFANMSVFQPDGSANVMPDGVGVNHVGNLHLFVPREVDIPRQVIRARIHHGAAPHRATAQQIRGAAEVVVVKRSENHRVVAFLARIEILLTPHLAVALRALSERKRHSVFSSIRSICSPAASMAPR